MICHGLFLCSAQTLPLGLTITAMAVVSDLTQTESACFFLSCLAAIQMVRSGRAQDTVVKCRQEYTKHSQALRHLLHLAKHFR